MDRLKYYVILLTLLILSVSEIVQSQSDSLDMRVQRFMTENKNNWRDMNIPEKDGQVLFDIIRKNGYTRALEIGTSTGRSGIWLAWALSKNGGKLVTIEIDSARFYSAKRNFELAGVSPYVEQKLGDAHHVITQLTGPYDFIFIDAEKTGYSRYLRNLLPKLTRGGCFTAHNVSNRYMTGIKAFLQLLYTSDSLETYIDNSSRSGISISYKK